MQNFMLNLLRKSSLKKSNILQARQAPKFLGVAISSHIVSLRFLLISGHFQITQENQNQSNRSRKIYKLTEIYL